MSLEDTYYDYDTDDSCADENDDEDVDYALADISMPRKRKNDFEDYFYELLSPDDIVKCMIEFIQDANGFVGLPETTTRILLNYFKWDKEKFVNAFFNGDQDQMFEKAHIANPYKEYCGGQTSNQQPSNDPEECEVCLTEIPKNMMTGLECGHLFCEDCWNDYLKTRIVDEGIVQTIQCAASSCEVLVDDVYVMKLVKDPKVKQKYQRLISNDFVECNQLMKWCPNGCETVIKVEKVEAKPVKCKCSCTFCFGCAERWHDPVNCALLCKWNKRSPKGDLESNEWILNYAKNCPKCDVPIEKNGGCNHMTCRNTSCRYEFCWLCFGQWPHLQGCNRFNEEKAKAKAKQEAAREKIQVALQRYTFFGDRYMNHQQSLKFENQLHNNILEKMRQFQDEFDMTYNQVCFLQKAVEVLVSCRQTLMYTYVFAFYLEKNSQTEIFEDNQNFLENAVEELSGYLERDIAVQNLTQLKPKVQDKSKYCDERRIKLLEHIHEGNDKSKQWWVFMDI